MRSPEAVARDRLNGLLPDGNFRETLNKTGVVSWYETTGEL